MVPDRARALLVTRSARAILAIASLFCVLAFAQVAALAYNFPALTGRVVDQANIIPEATREEITQKLADLEQKSGIQLAVATVNSLEGGDVETYANELFRTWKLGEKDKNNGVLLLVAPNEHKGRIEVGYGLEGTLTDALSKLIISNAMTPRFKAGDFGGGISRGVDDIITVLTTDSSQWQPRLQVRADADKNSDAMGWVLIVGFIVVVVLLGVSPGFRWFFFNVVLNMLLSSGSSRGGDSSGGSWGGGGGGFSGGGGSSGGGGASGGW
ncbi:MAG: TPM domain-containing protein [Methylovirgula sp.]|nr:TPM domain-containing protein [Methylovirgula sp.]